MSVDKQLPPGAQQQRRTATAAWVGTWTLIAVAFWLPFVWRAIAWMNAGTAARFGWPRLLQQEFGVEVKNVLDFTYDQLRILSLVLAAAGVVVADRMRQVEPRWLGWLAVAGALAALVSSLWNPALFV